MIHFLVDNPSVLLFLVLGLGYLLGKVRGGGFLVLNGARRPGDLTGGLMAPAWGATFSVVAGGLAAVIGTGLYALAVPELPRYTADDDIMPIEDPAPWRGET